MLRVWKSNGRKSLYKRSPAAGIESGKRKRETEIGVESVEEKVQRNHQQTPECVSTFGKGETELNIRSDDQQTPECDSTFDKGETDLSIRRESEVCDLLNDMYDADNKPSIYVHLVPAVVNVIRDGVTVHLKSLVGGKRDQQAIDAIVQRVGLFIAWSYDVRHDDDLNPDEFDEIFIDSWYTQVLDSPGELITQFVDFLQSTRNLKLSSARQYIESIYTYSKWFVDYKVEKEKLSLERLIRAVTAIRTSAKNEDRKSIASNRSIEDLIKSGQWPAKGMLELQMAVNKRIQEWAIPTFDKRGAQRAICELNYKEFLQLVASAIYVEAPQGRIGGIAQLSASAYDEFISSGYALAQKFKTSSTFGFQPVALSEKSCKLVMMYYQLFRPVAEMNAKQKCNRMWLNWNGTAMDNGELGKHLTSFFKSQLQLHITTTTIRAIVETAAEDALKKGIIDGIKRAAISNVNGHSGATTQRHYVKNSRISDVHDGRAGINCALLVHAFFCLFSSLALLTYSLEGFDAMFNPAASDECDGILHFILFHLTFLLIRMAKFILLCVAAAFVLTTFFLLSMSHLRS
jgi:hypothetical protein